MSEPKIPQENLLTLRYCGIYPSRLGPASGGSTRLVVCSRHTLIGQNTNERAFECAKSPEQLGKLPGLIVYTEFVRWC
jgi:hypothetical protein